MMRKMKKKIGKVLAWASVVMLAAMAGRVVRKAGRRGN